MNLADCRLRIGRRRIRHRLHGNWRVAANGHAANHNPTRLAPLNFPVGTNAHRDRSENHRYNGK
jgi:hypothetical protein